MIDLSEQEITNLLGLINTATVRGSDVEIVTLLKQKLITAKHGQKENATKGDAEEGQEDASKANAKKGWKKGDAF